MSRVDPVARKAYRDAYYATNRDAILAANALHRGEWEARDPWRRARIAAYAASKQDRKYGRGSPVIDVTVFARLHLLPCANCGVTPALGADHIFPFAGGGTNTVENLQPMCLPCNQRKSGPRPTRTALPQ